MKTKTKISILLLLLVFSLTSCKGNTAAPASQPSATASESQ